MPIYAYRCDSCGHAKDVLQKISDPLLTVCPVCGAASFRKQVTAAGFQLKGSGWYVTDFRGDGKTPAAKEGAEAAKPDAAKEPAAGAPAAKTDAPAAPAPSAAPASPAPTASGGGSASGAK